MAVFRTISNSLWDSYAAMLGETVLLRDQAVFQYTNAGGFVITVRGANFTYDTLGIPTGGNITQITVRLAGELLSNFTQLTYDLAALNTFTFGTTSGSIIVVAPDTESLFRGLRFGNDVIFSNAQGRNISGYDGNDTIHAGAGDDWMSGGAGVDRFYGDDGLDGVFFGLEGNPLHGVHVDMRLAIGNIIDDGHGNTETATSVEMYEGTDFADTIQGGGFGDRTFWSQGGNDLLSGGGGNDNLYAGDGNDTLFGGSNDDILVGGSGIDRFNGGAGFDILAFWGVIDHGVTVNLSVAGNVVIDDGFGNAEVAVNFEVVSGSEFGDTLTGSSAADELAGHGGRDILSGLGGSDTLFGGAIGDRLTGGSGNDMLYGNEHGDRVIGGSGEDLIYGGSGMDTLLGGAGADEFAFLANETGFDRITDFVHGIDKINIFSGLAEGLVWPVLTAAQFRSGAGATTAINSVQRLIHDTTTGSLYIDADGVGGAAAVKFAELTNGAVLTYTDFWVIV